MKALRDPVLVALAAVALAYAAISNQYYLFLLIIGALTVIVGVGLNVLIGLTGQVSFGHVGFYALGAYVTAVLTTKLGVPFWWTLPVAAVLTGVIGALLGLVALRVSGPYLAMVTIAFGFVVEFTAVEWESVTGGQNGLMNVPYPSLAGWSIGERGIAVTAILLMIVALALYKRLAQSGWGLAMRAVRDSETAAGAMGVNPLAIRTLAFTVSAVLAGVAGSFFASATTFVAPSTFTFFQSILFVLVVVIGGAERTYGPVIGAAIVIGLPEVLSGFAEYRVLLFGVLLLAVLLYAPGGIAGAVARRFGSAATRGSGGAGFGAAPVRRWRREAGAGAVRHKHRLRRPARGIRRVRSRRGRHGHQHHRSQRRRQDDAAQRDLRLLQAGQRLGAARATASSPASRPFASRAPASRARSSRRNCSSG